MLQPKKLKSVPLPFRLASILFLLLPLWWTYTNLLFAPNTPYSVEQLNVSGAVEYRFKFNGHHFMTLIDLYFRSFNEYSKLNLKTNRPPSIVAKAEKPEKLIKSGAVLWDVI
jgi:hypothetical protein